MSNELQEIAVEQSACRRSKPVNWYRTPVESGLMKKLHARSNVLGAFQCLGYLGIVATTGTLAFYSGSHWPWWVTALLLFVHGTVFAFQVNAVHELGHGTVFKTRALNALFDRVFGFLGWINFHLFEASHARHHRYTLHPPDDLEVVLPMHVMVKEFILKGFIDPVLLWAQLKNTIRIALGRFEGEWELKLFPEKNPAARRSPVRWARTLLVGHGLIIVVSAVFDLWMLPVVTSLAPFYGGWLFFLCNNTQHIGLQDNVGDFRLCCRTFTVNPFVQFLYWHMNYHIEHHMYAAVPCYRLGRLHRAIRHDLPPTPAGIIETWKQIGAIQMRQKRQPDYQYKPPIPQNEH